LPEGVTTLTFKAIQSYSDGEQVAWIEQPAPGSTAEPEHPAPELHLAAAASAGQPATSASSSAPTVSATPAAAASPGASQGAATTGIVLGAIGVALGAGALFIALRRGRSDGGHATPNQ
jgi:periplasmic copper chaperone A